MTGMGTSRPVGMATSYSASQVTMAPVADPLLMAVATATAPTEPG